MNCQKCKGTGLLGWLDFSEVVGDPVKSEAYFKTVECPNCHGDGGWDVKPERRMTLNDLIGIVRSVQ